MYNYWKKLSVQDCVDMKYNKGALQDCNLKQYFVPEVEPLLAHDVADLHYYRSVVGQILSIYLPKNKFSSIKSCRHIFT